jgi:hypothetical protein
MIASEENLAAPFNFSDVPSDIPDRGSRHCWRVTFWRATGRVHAVCVTLVPRQYRQPSPAFREDLIRQPEKHRRCGDGHTTITVKPRIACQNMVRCSAQSGFGIIN